MNRGAYIRELSHQELESGLTVVNPCTPNQTWSPLGCWGGLRKERLGYSQTLDSFLNNTLSANTMNSNTTLVQSWIREDTKYFISHFCKIVFSPRLIPSLWPYHHLHNKEEKSDVSDTYLTQGPYPVLWFP